MSILAVHEFTFGSSRPKYESINYYIKMAINNPDQIFIIGSVSSTSTQKIMPMVKESINHYLMNNNICEIRKAEGKQPLQFCA